MVLRLIGWVLASCLCCQWCDAAIVTDEAALMQSVRARSDLLQTRRGEMVTKTTRKVYLQDLLETTKGLVKAGVTPEVVKFVNEAINDIKQSVIPVIHNEHDTDQRMLDSLFGAFDTIETTYEKNLALFHGAQKIRGEVSYSHSSCRDLENTACLASQACDAVLDILLGRVQQNETHLNRHDGTISDHWCTDTNRTVRDFREGTIPYFEDYIATKKLLDDALEKYHEKKIECDGLRQDHEDKKVECEQFQGDLEEKACSHGVSAQNVHDRYTGAFDLAESTYQTTEDSIEIEEADRKVEYSTLHMILCLLDNINNLTNGSAALAGVEFETHLDACRDAIFNTSHLNITYYDVPDRSGLPEIPAAPCTERYIHDEYWGFPKCIEIDTGACLPCTAVMPKVHVPF